MRGSVFNRRFVSFMLVLVVGAVCLAGCSGGSSGSDASDPVPFANTIMQMTASIPQQLADNGIHSAVIALVDDQRVVWAQGFGYADAANQIPATPETQYEIGSVSKLLAGTMIMQLSDQARLDIGDPLTLYIPGFSIGQPLGFSVSSPDPITLRSILTHHTGIPGDIFNWSATLTPDPGFNDKLIAYLVGDYLAYPTNFNLDYSNSAIALLSSVIAAASGQTFDVYSDALFQTLGMDHSSFSWQSPRITGAQAKGYSGEVEQPRYAINVTTAGSVVSTVLDMAKFIKMVHVAGMGERGRVLNTATLETMLTQSNGAIPLDGAQIGLSWFLSDTDLGYAGRLCWHNGETMGFVSHLEILRDQKLGVVVLINEAEAGNVATAIAKQTLKLALADKTGLLAPNPVPTYGPLVTWDQAQLDDLQGIYVLSSGTPGHAYITVQSVPGALEFVNSSGATVHIAPRANGWLSDPVLPDVEYEFSGQTRDGRPPWQREGGYRRILQPGNDPCCLDGTRRHL